MNVLLIDDEKIALEGLKDHIPWRELGIDTLRYCLSGEEAVSLCMQAAPDIIISDVRMPGMTGVEFCSWAREFLPGCQLIFLSGYADKEYLKAAIRLDAVSYLEKPVDLLEVCSAIELAAERLQKNKSQHSTQTHSLMTRHLALLSILDNQIDTKTTDFYYQTLLDNHAGHACFCITSWRIRDLETGGDPAKVLAPVLASVFPDGVRDIVRQNGHEALALLSAADKESFSASSKTMRKLATLVRTAGYRMFGGIGEAFISAEQLQTAARSSALAKQELFFTGYGHISFQHAVRSFSFEPNGDVTKAFQQALQLGDQNAALTALRQLHTQILAQPSLLPSAIRGIYFQLLQSCASAGHSTEIKEESALDVATLWQTIMAFDTFHALHQWAEKQLCKQLPTHTFSAAVQQVHNLVLAQYADETTTLRSLAQQVYLSPSYLANLFRQETGYTVVDYLTNVRINHAKQLLHDRKLTLYYIAIAVGYQDASYFSRVFRKVTGMSPSTYRERMSA